MPFSVYEVTVPAMSHGLRVLVDYVDRARSLETTRGMDPGSVLAARLAPDMLSFGQQVAVGCDKVEAHMAKLLDRETPAPRATAMAYTALKSRLAGTLTFLDGLRRDELASSQSRTYELVPPVMHGWFNGDD